VVLKYKVVLSKVNGNWFWLTGLTGVWFTGFAKLVI
jgi:hypothetical protein